MLFFSAQDLEALEEISPTIAAIFASAPAPVDAAAYAVCEAAGGCIPEGRVRGPFIVGRCARCGAGAIDDFNF